MTVSKGFGSGIATAVMLALMSGTAGAQDAAQPAPAHVLPSIVVTKAEMKPVVDRVVATGTIQAREETYVLPLVEGLAIKTLDADIGDRVEAAQTLATLNEDMLLLEKSQDEASRAKAVSSLARDNAALVEARATADQAVKVRDRSKRLAASGSVSSSVADADEASAAEALARLTSAEQAIAVATADIAVVDAQLSDIALRLTRTALKAPFGGIISARMAKVGAIASGSGSPLFTIIRDGEVEMKADVSESDLTKLAVGQTATVTLADGRDTLTGKIRLISPVVDNQTRLGSVYISLGDSAKARVGMYADTHITVEEKQAIVLPLTAVTNTKEGTSVRKVEQGVVKLVTVETGIQDGKFIEITKGLTPGDEVVAKAGAYVRDGDKINPVQSAAAATN